MFFVMFFVDKSVTAETEDDVDNDNDDDKEDPDDDDERTDSEDPDDEKTFDDERSWPDPPRIRCRSLTPVAVLVFTIGITAGPQTSRCRGNPDKCADVEMSTGPSLE